MLQSMKAIKYGLPALMLAGTVAATTASKINNTNNEPKIEIVAENQPKQDVVSISDKNKVLKVDKGAKLQKAGFFSPSDNEMFGPLVGVLLTFGLIFGAKISNDFDEKIWEENYCRERGLKTKGEIARIKRNAGKYAKKYCKRVDKLKKPIEQYYSNLKNYEDDLKAITITPEDMDKCLKILGKRGLETMEEYNYLKQISKETGEKIRNLESKFHEIMLEMDNNSPRQQRHDIYRKYLEGKLSYFPHKIQHQISEYNSDFDSFVIDTIANTGREKIIRNTYYSEKEKLEKFRRKIDPYYDVKL